LTFPKQLVCKTQTMQAESDNATVESIKSGPHEYIPNIDATGWCRKNLSKHVCCDVSDEESCPICLDPLVHDSKVLKLNCGHTMHIECADKWFTTCIMSEKAANCPLCKLAVEKTARNPIGPKHTRSSANSRRSQLLETLFRLMVE